MEILFIYWFLNSRQKDLFNIVPTGEDPNSLKYWVSYLAGWLWQTHSFGRGSGSSRFDFSYRLDLFISPGYTGSKIIVSVILEY